jgi:hypothetical protein
MCRPASAVGRSASLNDRLPLRPDGRHLPDNGLEQEPAVSATPLVTAGPSDVL